jgi:hypothetical protein
VLKEMGTIGLKVLTKLLLSQFGLGGLA